MFPLQFGTDAQFAAAHEILDRCGYAPLAICRYYGLKEINDYRLDAPQPEHKRAAEHGFETVSRLFLEGGYVTAAEMALLSPDGGRVFADLGLVAPREGHPGQFWATMALVPTSGFYLVSDRWNRPDGSAFTPAEDIVYPGHIYNTQLFIDSIDDSPCEALLDIGAGSGIAAMAGARYAKRSVAADIAHRSALCTEFNRRLNRIQNLEAVTGDLYEPVAGQTFDRIVAHPPYVPVLEKKWIFHSGGEDGEQIMRGIIAGLPTYLRPGGKCYLLSMGSDRKDATLEQRLREMLGPDNAEFDVALLERNQLEPSQFAEKSAQTTPTLSAIQSWKEVFERLGVVSMVYGTIVIQRHDSPRSAFTIRRPAHKDIRRSQIEWMMRWETEAQTQASLDRVLSSALYPAPEVNLHVTHRLQNNDWTPVQYQFEIEYPFSSKSPCHGWMVRLLAACDGKATGREICELLRTQGVIPQNAPPAEFAQALRMLVSAGLIEVEGMRVPRSLASGASAS